MRRPTSEGVLEEFWFDHGLKANVDTDVGQDHAAGLFLANVLGRDLDGTVGEREAAGIVGIQAGKLIAARDDSDAPELKQLFGGLAERLANGLDEFLRLGSGGGGRPTLLSSRAELRVVEAKILRRGSGIKPIKPANRQQRQHDQPQTPAL